MYSREFRKLYVSDLKIVMHMDEDFRKDFACEENARMFLSNPMNWIFESIYRR